LKQDFWKQWSDEYLARLQQRPKWLDKSTNVVVGDLVLLKEDCKAPGKWPLARILETHRGADGLIRVVTLRISNGIYKRPITKLSPLPVDEPERDGKPITAAAIQRSYVAEGINSATNATRTTSLERPHIKKQQKSQQTTGVQHVRRSPRIQERMRMSTNVSFLTICLLGMIALVFGDESKLLNGTLNENITLARFERQPGIYFENKGNLSFIRGEWDIIIYYNLSHYKHEMESILGCLHQLNYLCLTTYGHQPKMLCERTLPLVRQQIESLVDKDKFIFSNYEPNTPKRFVVTGAVGMGIGAAATAIYNKFSSSQQIEDAIFKLKGNEDHVLELVKNQTSIIEGTSSVIKHNRILMDQQIESVFQQVKSLRDAVDDKEQMLAVKQGFNEIIQHLILIIMNYR
jgi:hypothetical protein